MLLLCPTVCCRCRRRYSSSPPTTAAATGNSATETASVSLSEASRDQYDDQPVKSSLSKLNDDGIPTYLCYSSDALMLVITTVWCMQVMTS